MEAAQLRDEEFQQLKHEFYHAGTTLSRRTEVAQKLMTHFLRRFKSELLRRSQTEQLSDRELALIAYDGNVDERILQQINERSLTESLRDQYIQIYLKDRFKQQLAFQGGKVLVNVGSHLLRFGWQGFKQSFQADAPKLLLTKLVPLDVLANNSLILNFAGVGIFLVYDLAKSIYLYSQGIISGKQFIKRMTASLLSNSGAVAGGFLGMTLGGLFAAILGPLGAVIVGIGFGVAASTAFSFLGTFLNELLWKRFDEEEKEKVMQELIEKARVTLGVLQADDFRTITRKWKTEILKYHPDKNPDANEREKEAFGVKFQEAHLAYRLLRDEELRHERISKVEIDNIAKTNPLIIIEKDGWIEDEEQGLLELM